MNIRAPKKPLANSYQPMGGQPYKVRDGDSWWTLSTRAKVDPWWLIQYNFETRDPAEVNWYLQYRVGCVNKTQDGKNLKFSSSAKPGFIYLPTAQIVRSLKSLAFGKFGISIAGDKDYQDEVKKTIDWIATSDTGMVLLDHAGFNPLVSALSTSKGFVSHIPNRNKMCELIASEPDLSNALKKVHSYFNPFAEAL